MRNMKEADNRFQSGRSIVFHMNPGSQPHNAVAPAKFGLGNTETFRRVYIFEA